MVVRLKEWARIQGISYGTAKRLLESGKIPHPVTRISPKLTMVHVDHVPTLQEKMAKTLDDVLHEVRQLRKETKENGTHPSSARGSAAPLQRR